jgi:TrmH family RNA methyltransferase
MLTIVPEFRLIFVEPKNPGNLGSIARIMKNFGFGELYITNTYRIPPEDQFRSMKGSEILKKASLVKSLGDAVEGLKYVVGTSGVKTDSIKGVVRNHMTPTEFAQKVRGVKGKIGIVMGREDIGLTNEELSMCDYFIHIPASEEYPIMNVSHAAAIILKELASIGNAGTRPVADRKELELLINKFKSNLEQNGYPPHRISKTTLMFRRIISRALINEYEYRVLMGALECRTRPDENRAELLK